MCQEPQNKFRDLLPPHAGIKTLPNSESQTGRCGPVTQAGRRPRSPALTPRPAGRRAFPGAGPQHNRASLQLRSGLVLIAHLNPEANKVTEGSDARRWEFPQLHSPPAAAAAKLAHGRSLIHFKAKPRSGSALRCSASGVGHVTRR